ncbi:MAG: thioredoxin fold domain-containing protein, partial [Gammaproteobacteria bacterium]|nr:thioredoxin fold domain-containing protein [Gammaproteobacteria bacterium]
MKKPRLIFLLLAFYAVTGTSFAKDLDDSEIKHIGYPGWFTKSDFLDLADELEKAKSKGKKGLMILFTTEGCSYCSFFIHKSLGDPEIAKVVRNNFDSLGMEIFDDTEMISPQGAELPIKQFAKQEGVQFSPSLLFYGHDGKIILRKTGYQSPERFKNMLSYIANDHYQSESFASFLTQQATNNSSTTTNIGLTGNPHFEKPPYALDRSRFPADKPLLVIFEKSNCIDCESFHQKVLALDEVDRTLERFNVVRLDASDTSTPVLAPNGVKTDPAKWYQQEEFTHVPALMFIDPSGNTSL